MMSPPRPEDIQVLAELVRRAQYCVALTGAGVSTESGLPDFRSPDTGLWERLDPMVYLSTEALEDQPGLFYTTGMELLQGLVGAEPNEAHRGLASLERDGLVKSIVTQNIDGLHHKAGSKRVYEVHGHLRSGHCTACRANVSFAALVEKVGQGQIPPRCDRCGGTLRPDVVLFGDPMPEAFRLAEREVLRSDLLLVLGSSLQVAPVCYLPQYATNVAIVNLEPTQYDGLAAVVIHAPAGEVMAALVEEIAR